MSAGEKCRAGSRMGAADLKIKPSRLTLIEAAEHEHTVVERRKRF